MRSYHLLDVFTTRAFGGNQLAVFTDGKGLTTEQMQTVAKELNLAETVFIIPPDDAAHHCRLRIFTPGREMLMAGHPTVGTAYLLADLGQILETGHTVFEEGVGPIPLDLSEHAGTIQVRMTQPIPEFGRVEDDRATTAQMLSIAPDDLHPDAPVQVVSAGVPFLFVPLKSLDVIRRVSLRLDIYDKHVNPQIAVFVFTLETEDPAHTVHSRMFSPPMKIAEDPATGAASGPLGAYLVQHKLVTAEQGRSMVSEQGYEMGRPSLIGIHIESADGIITNSSISGTAVRVGEGRMMMPPG